MKINETYLKYYMKKPSCLHLPYKLVNDAHIDLVFAKLEEGHSSLAKNCICVFNPFSLTNIIRDNESHKAFVDESEKTTASFEKLKAELFRMHENCSKRCPIIMDNLDASQQVFAAEYPNNDSSVYGLVGFEFIFDTSLHPAAYYAKMLAKKANMLNYNVVDFNLDSEDQNVEKDGKIFKLSRFDIQFEAAYQDKIDLKLGRYVYHVTTKNNAGKILKGGLLPSNKNSHGFNYPPRIYTFVDIISTLHLAEPYASASKKHNKKFIANADASKLVDLYKTLMKKECGVVVDTREFSILQIDLEKIGNVKFYRDNTFEVDGKFAAVYTEQAIKPDAIAKMQDFVLPYDGEDNI